MNGALSRQQHRRKQSITLPAAAQNSVGRQWKTHICGSSLFWTKLFPCTAYPCLLSVCGVVWSDMQPSIVAAADCRGRGIMLAACGGGNSVRMKRKPEPTPHQTTPCPNSTSAWLAYPGISNSFCIKTQPQERALVLDRHWRETDRCFHLRRIE